MKILIITLLSTILLACNNNKELPQETIQKPTKPAATVKGKIDPVCEMVQDTAWTNLTIYNGDTIKFCSENCKKAFEARPTKYSKHS